MSDNASRMARWLEQQPAGQYAHYLAMSESCFQCGDLKGSMNAFTMAMNYREAAARQLDGEIERLQRRAVELGTLIKPSADKPFDSAAAEALEIVEKKLAEARSHRASMAKP
jgi:hypothetical protein